MRVFLDQDVPHNVRRSLKPRGQEVVTAFHQGWSELENVDQTSSIGRISPAAKLHWFVLGNGNWPIVQKHLAEIVAAVDASTPNSYAFVEMPMPPKPPYKRP